MTPRQSTVEAIPQQAMQPAVETIAYLPRSDGGIFLEPQSDLLAQLPESLNPNPLLRNVRGLGETSLLAVRTSGEYRDDVPTRHHRLYNVQINEFKHVVEVTDPVNRPATHAVLSLPGLTEKIEGGIRQTFHAHMSHLFPDARIISIGSDGIGPNSGTYSWGDRIDHNLEGMAEHRIELAIALAESMPIFLHATSMGSAISARMHKKLRRSPELQQLVPIHGQFLTSPALVDPHNIPRDLAVAFLPKLLVDFAKEVGLKSSLQELRQLKEDGKNMGLAKRDLLALGNQVIGLMGGTAEADVAAMIETTPTVVVAGEKDPVAQWKMWRRIGNDYGDNLELHPIRGRGHVMAMKPGRLCEKLGRTARARVCQELGHNALLGA